MKQCPACQTSYPETYSHCPRDGMSLVDSVLWSDGSIIKEKYRILGQAGAGGMAVVYKAQHIPFEELRALKVMNADLASDDSFVRRFTQEALLTRRLQHPNAVRVDDIEKAEDGRSFIVMEFIEGHSLKDVLERGRLQINRACSIARQVASALDAAHSLGMVHRDIKPGNILLANTPAGEQVKVVDFGIARVKKTHEDGSHSTLTNMGGIVGSPAYLSPEQAAGRTDAEVDARSDLYSLGVVMYEMLSGELPLEAKSPAGYFFAHVNTPPVSLRTRCPTLPEPLANIVMSCLSKDPARRPASAKALIESLDAWQQPPPPRHAPTILKQENVTPPVSPSAGAGAPTVLRPKEQKSSGIHPQPPNTPPPQPLRVPSTQLSTHLTSAALAALGWFTVLWFVEFLAQDGRLGATSPVPWLVCGAGLGAIDLLLLSVRRLLNPRRAGIVMFGWLIGAGAAALFAYLETPLVEKLWSLVIESIDVKSATIHQAFIAAACLICILIGSLTSLKSSALAAAHLPSKTLWSAYACLVVVYLAVSAIELASRPGEAYSFAPNIAVAGSLARFAKSVFITRKVDS